MGASTHRHTKAQGSMGGYWAVHAAQHVGVSSVYVRLLEEGGSIRLGCLQDWFYEENRWAFILKQTHIKMKHMQVFYDK